MSESDSPSDIQLNVGEIKKWRSIITLIVFVGANIVVLFPFHIPIPVPYVLWKAIKQCLGGLRVTARSPHYDIPEKRRSWRRPSKSQLTERRNKEVSRPQLRTGTWVWFQFSVDFVTGPLIADLFLLAIGAIGKEEIVAGIVGKDNIVPYDILLFFFSLAYIAISIDASGLIRYAAFKVLQWGGKVGHRLFFFLYVFFFLLGSFIGNDPIILSGTAFLAYMTRVSSNIVHPRAWIHTQFAIANIASAILVSSNPTNLVLAGAFQITFIDYTKDMIVPVVITALLMFPFLLYFVFADEKLIPNTITMHDLSEDQKKEKPVNPHIPFARGSAAEEEKKLADTAEGNLLSLVEIMNPFLDKPGAIVGGTIITAALVSILVINAKSGINGQETPVFYITLPAAVIMLAFDIAWGWINRHETREISRAGRKQIEEEETRAAAERNAEAGVLGSRMESPEADDSDNQDEKSHRSGSFTAQTSDEEKTESVTISQDYAADRSSNSEVGNKLSVGGTSPHDSSIAMLMPKKGPEPVSKTSEQTERLAPNEDIHLASPQNRADTQNTQITHTTQNTLSTQGIENEKQKAQGQVSFAKSEKARKQTSDRQKTLVSVTTDAYRWSQETFPTVVAVLAHLPFALLPFSFEMFILVQGLSTKGWVPVFAYGWDHWIDKTSTVGAVGGMGFLSVILCNFAGTNIGTTILLSRVIQAWKQIHDNAGTVIPNRTWWATIYAMALGVNYGAFSVAFSASLAGLLWRDILSRKHIHVGRLEFARINLPIIAVAMVIGSAVLVGEVYLFK
ncbi:hypothetical protein GGR57DRAFT_489741 [Xylariaceae sp. FL1272]|nr:hypothetical protein GGR57DRAFT_489741 [Xylariaceae sp. FL1272]